MPDALPLDDTALQRLIDLGGPGFARDMVKMFLDYADTKLGSALRAGRAGDWGAVEKAVHPLKTSAGHVGANVMRDLAAQIEKLARTDDPSAIPGLLSALDQAYRQIKPRLAELLQAPAA